MNLLLTAFHHTCTAFKSALLTDLLHALVQRKSALLQEVRSYLFYSLLLPAGRSLSRVLGPGVRTVAPVCLGESPASGAKCSVEQGSLAWGLPSVSSPSHELEGHPAPCIVGSTMSLPSHELEGYLAPYIVRIICSRWRLHPPEKNRACRLSSALTPNISVPTDNRWDRSLCPWVHLCAADFLPDSAERWEGRNSLGSNNRLVFIT